MVMLYIGVVWAVLILVIYGGGIYLKEREKCD
ncbi:hypothetical protein LCGC14_2218810 [marine sediment metagenome]|uniref:Uncharacterized protein n=1 Tax=marine sediment metagenome TaxID=412755 RepID=A0A0F9DBR2_9ZZZZ